ncbi:helix-turn-helix domain-containing protein [Lederbergia citrea]|uniref:helix-turn-helix domain-containing protein n=1 Tax=Lederbergia citrea TaxID=2833581 RepID=UPI001BC9024C|nr:RodZ family helix-turn-helix domain-containing protein [Lederbergia citrea]MBS4177052.1 helix-turn-helix domain-containing protein [Lederbergia citrea]
MTELGSRLRNAREEKGLSLDELQNMTRIQKKYLIGIEEGNYDIMPGKFYARAFIKQYAEAVGLEPEELFEEHKNEIPLAYEDDLPEQLSRTQSRKTVSAGGSKIMEMFPKILAAIFVLAFLILIWYLVTNYMGTREKPSGNNNHDTVDIQESDEIAPPEDKEKKSSDNSNKQADDKDKGQQEEVVQQDLAVENVSGYVTTYTLSKTDTFELKVTASNPGRSWVEIRNGTNTTLFSGEISNGDSKSFDLTDETGAYIVVGRATEADLFVNDEKLEYELPPGNTVRQDIKIQFEKK